MNKRNNYFILAVVVLLMSVLPMYSFSWEEVDASGEKDPNVSRGVVFYPNGDMESSLNYIKNTNKDESFVNIRELLLNGSINVKIDRVKSVTSQMVQSNQVFAFSVDDVKNSLALQALTQALLKAGKTVYLYGNSLTVGEYESLVGVTQLSANDNSTKKLKEESRSKELKLVSSSQRANVIGYNTNGDLHLANIEVGLTKGETEKQEHYQTFMFIRSILDDQVEYIENNQKKSESLSIMGISIPFIQRNKASAESVNVDDRTDIDTYVSTGGGITVGNLNTDWFLFKDKSETNDEDWFTIETNYEADGYNGYDPYEMDIRHDLPFAGDVYDDEIYDWKPLSDGSKKFTISIPWGLSYTFQSGGDIDVNESGSQDYDWSRWFIDDDWNAADLPDPVRFKPSTAWLSGDTYAGIDVSNEVWFWNGNNIYYGEQNLEVRYDY